jgi:FkbM family methyltransferase
MKYPFYLRLGSSDLQLHQTIRFRGEYEPVVRDRFSGDIRQVVDLGANAGYTMRLWRELFPNARLIGVEPDPGNMRVCRLNAASIPGVRLDFIEACVDGKRGSVWLDRSEAEHQFHMADEPSTQTIEVPALTVPEILERAGADEEIGLLKCDVQGAEKAIFENCRSWIARVRNMIIEVHPPYGPEDLMADLERNGWQWKRHVAHRTDNLWVLFFWAADPPDRAHEAIAAENSAARPFDRV